MIAARAGALAGPIGVCAREFLEAIVDKRRRKFLKTAGSAALAGVSYEAPRSPVAAQAATSGSGTQGLPKGMSFCTLAHGYGVQL